MSSNEPAPYKPTLAGLREHYLEMTETLTGDPEVAAGNGRYFDQAIADVLADADRPAPCRMTHTEPFDFAQCQTHDKTFPLGATCPWDGVESITGKLQDDVDEQRRLKVRAQHVLEQLQVGLAGHIPVPCARCGNKPVLVPDTDPDDHRDMRVCWDCDVIIGTQMRKEYETELERLRAGQ